ncbi:MAG: hypothetical protein R3B48_07965 [Kofleriaceae bacterium]
MNGRFATDATVATDATDATDARAATAPLWRALCAAMLALALLAGGCDKPGWLADLEHKLDVAVPQIISALDQLAEELPAAVDRLDAVAGQRLAELDAELRDAVDGLNLVLAQNQGRLDAALTARVEDLARYAAALSADVHAVSLGLTTRVTASVDSVLRDTRASAQRLLATLGGQLAHVEEQGDRAVAQVADEAQDTIVRLAGGAALALGLLGGALVVLLPIARRRPAAFALQMVLATAVAGVGAALVLSGSLRARLVPTQEVIVGHDACSAPLAEAANLLGLTAASAADATALLPRLAACQALATSRAQLDAARARLLALRAKLGATARCAADEDCPAGSRCDLARGACQAGCRRDADCAAGTLCHPLGARCAPPCGACPTGARCVASRCESVLRLPGIDRGPLILGGRGELSACLRDPACRARVLAPRR